MKRRPLAWALALTASLPFVASGAPRQPQSLLLGNFDSEFEPALVDPAFPTGARRFDDPRPDAAVRECSPRRPVCAHASSMEALPKSAVSELEQAYELVVLGLGAPSPMPDADGGSPALDVYLVEDVATVRVHPDPSLGRSDRAPGFCVAPAPGFDLHGAVRCVAGAALLSLDAAETPAIRAGIAAHLGSLASGPGSSALQAIDDAQSKPNDTLFPRDARKDSDAGALFWEYLEQTYGSGRFGELSLAVLSQSRRDEASSGPRWNNEPDVFDVLRNALDNDSSRFADLVIDFAIARAFLGDRSDGTHVPGDAFLGTFGRVHFDWVIDSSSLPRNVASPAPLEPMGSSYVWLDTRALQAHSEIAASFAWEAPVRFRFAIVAIDGQGRELQRFDVPYFERGTEMDRTVLVPKDSAGLLFVSTNLGGVHVDYPFDPDHEPWERHSYQLYVAKL